MEKIEYCEALNFYDPAFFDAGVGDATDSAKLELYYQKIGPTKLSILDIGAGTGRVALPLLSQGNTVVCLDSSKLMLDSLKIKIGSLPSDQQRRVRIINQQIGPKPESEPLYDILLAVDDFITHFLSLESLVDFFKDSKTWLKSNGRLLTDVRPRKNNQLEMQCRIPSVIRTFGIVNDVKTSIGRMDISTNYYEVFELKTRLMKTTCQYHYINASGVVDMIKYSQLLQRFHTYAEISSAAKTAGLKILSVVNENQKVDYENNETWGMFEFAL